MAATATSSMRIATAKHCAFASRTVSKSSIAVFGNEINVASSRRLKSSCLISSTRPFYQSFTTDPVKFEKLVTKAMSESSEDKPFSGLTINLRGKRAFIAGIADDNGYGWAIAKSLAAAGAEILVGTWVPALNIFETSLRRGKFDDSRKLPDGSLMEIAKVYPLDAVYDTPEDVPESVKTNKRYAGASNWTVKEVAESVKQDFGTIDILVHSLANGPERYTLGCRYGGGMSSAKAALESDTQVLAFEAGRKHKIRVNTISAGPLGSRAAKAIGFIDMIINYSLENAPIQKELLADVICRIPKLVNSWHAKVKLNGKLTMACHERAQKITATEEVGNTAAFLVSPLASAITGAVIYVDNGLNAMGVGVDSPAFADLDIPKDKQS
ncbi:hypothetical protein RJ640_029678 [Escallonia rubra]|uniref:Uncharacterized protein n=1 Tax=Escallonia rubra TaxID=112253 RepID=A0AA88U3Q9_9ASTE|nr:hypothetical protein RJ640_029678 [Escallonia rubra]